MPNKKTQEQFIAEAIEIHNGRYDYSLVNYINSKTKVKILCKIHGEFMQNPTSHLSGIGCPVCSGNTKLTTESFIEKAAKVHGNLYDYSNVVYTSSKSKVEIICRTHGSFWQVPSMHLSGNGCATCKSKIKYTNETFIDKANKVHGDRYDYSLVQYKDSNTKIKIICKEHGMFSVKPNSHLSGVQCARCKNTARYSLDEVIAKAKEIHGDRYDYSLVDYVNTKTTVKIICKVHGIFEQKMNSHLLGSGCKYCAYLGFGWTRTKFTDLVARKGRGIVYILKLSNSSETFLKIGITTRTVKHRICDFPYDVEILHEEIFNNGSLMFDLEKYLHRALKEYAYSPKIDFGGSTECFEVLPIDVIFDKIVEFKNINKVD